MYSLHTDYRSIPDPIQKCDQIVTETESPAAAIYESHAKN
jgi:hypothetical protein